jgi:tRNA pseudouridine13 synthase
MILKQTPEDFQVEELTSLEPGQGPFSLYRLEKSGWTTPDALQAIRRRWQLDQRRLSYGGLKDRHAQTVQYFTVFHGPQRRLTHQGFSVTYLGQVAEPLHSEHIRANSFQLILRDVSKEERAIFAEAFEEVRVSGVPNYFDDQRFGSVTPESLPGEAHFVAKAIILGRYEEALRLALTAHYPFDRRPQKKEKAVLRAHWGNWAECKDLLPRGHARSLVDYLVGHPDDFRGALARLRPELRGLYLSAYQSHLWNRMLAAWLRVHLPPDQLVLVPLKLGVAPMHRILGETDLERLRALQFPLTSHRTHFEADDPRRPFFDQVLQEENLTLDQFKLKGFKEMFFSRGDRPALCLPGNLKYTPNPDETHPGKQKLRLTFALPRGSYATLLVKRLFTPTA